MQTVEDTRQKPVTFLMSASPITLQTKTEIKVVLHENTMLANQNNSNKLVNAQPRQHHVQAPKNNEEKLLLTYLWPYWGEVRMSLDEVVVLPTP